MHRTAVRIVFALASTGSLSCASTGPLAHERPETTRYAAAKPSTSPVVSRDTLTAARVALPPMPSRYTPPEIPWREMTHAERARFMHEHVEPTMAALFRDFDPVRYADLDCTTCHGPNAVQKRFHMPTRALRPLPHPSSPAWAELAAESPRMVAFMTDRVTPAMAHSIGVRPFDPVTGSGFECFECHTQAE